MRLGGREHTRKGGRGGVLEGKLSLEEGEMERKRDDSSATGKVGFKT